ncbi:MAG TPA: cyclic nucleotide-binding domain-containing protein [Candidatus Saccharimonadales bacterium]|nr:cyclic nucleotide-binding domain-containing protein [Candidatus Saccharimonadales bacterium]
MTDLVRATPDVLRLVPLFRGLTDRSIAAITELVEPARYEIGAKLTRQGDPGDTFIILLEGEAVVERDGTELRRLGAGDFLGEIALFAQRARTATVTAVTPISALSLGREAFGRLVEEVPSVRLDIVTVLAERVRSLAPETID